MRCVCVLLYGAHCKPIERYAVCRVIVIVADDAVVVVVAIARCLSVTNIYNTVKV